mgnify:CR=1 FL=1
MRAQRSSPRPKPAGPAAPVRCGNPSKRTDRLTAVPAATERLFFAVRPDARTALRIEVLAQALRREHGLRGKTLGP